MNEQLTSPKAKARKEHPVQSHAAADSKNKSGTLSADRLEVLRLVAKYPGETAKGLDWFYKQLFKLDVGKAHRRAAELEAGGWIWRDDTGKEMRMYITCKGRELLEGME